MKNEAKYLNLLNRVHRLLCLTLVIGYLTFASFAYAQGQAGTDIAVLQAGVGARALGMGSAFTAIADNADAPFWNPAGLGFLTSQEITTMQTKLSTDTDHYYVSYVSPALGGTLGVSWIQVGLGNINQTSSEVDSHNEVQNISVFSYFSNAYLLSYGKELNEHFSFGVTAKYLTSDMYQIQGGQASGYSLSPGILFKTTTHNAKEISLGIKLDDLVNQQSWGTGAVEQALPKLRIGLAYRSPNPGLFAVDISQPIRSGYAPEISGGYEWNERGMSLRMGYAEGGFTAGAGFAIQHARVDYAYVAQRTLSVNNVHRISLSGIW